MTRRFAQLVFPTLLIVVLALASTADAAPARGDVQIAVSGEAREALLFYVFAGLTLISALSVALTRSVVRMAVWLFATLGGVAALYFLMAANFLAAIQLIVYAGGTLVLLIFGVMLTSKSPWVRFEAKRSEYVWAGLVCVLLAVTLIILLTGATWPGQTVAQGLSLAQFGQALLTTYLVPFEVTSVLLLVVMIGAAYLARQEK